MRMEREREGGDALRPFALSLRVRAKCINSNEGKAAK